MSPEAEEEMAVESVRSQVENVLQNHFGKNPLGGASDFDGKISTIPSKVSPEINSNVFYSMCGGFSDDLGQCLIINGTDVSLCMSNNRDSNAHVYLTTQVGRTEIVIDPTIGQFIEGYNHVFVGTRKQLKDLVVNRTGSGKQFQITHTKSRNNPKEAFERTWGNQAHVKVTVEKWKEGIKRLEL